MSVPLLPRSPTDTKEPPPLVVKLTLKALADPNAVPADCRLRRLLKALLRGYRFRCISVEDLTPKAAAASPASEESHETR